LQNKLNKVKTDKEKEIYDLKNKNEKNENIINDMNDKVKELENYNK
jgi:hypothetical protein